ncbi:MAG: MiaB/RimO family radical SAM methylthiotransferase [Actinomycetota bacterium]|nr:MiaB/RimO family radical SAM methylthiotransferase [Actinomycetota bacterium]
MGGKYLVRTFGCQMNEHDSERIAGVLQEQGLEPTSDLEDADVVVFNTCCIRENADNKLYGNLGALEALRKTKPSMQIAVGGCLAQKDGALIRRRAPHVDVVFGTFNVGSVGRLLERARREGPQIELLDSAGDAGSEELAAYPSALPVRRELSHAAWVTIQVGCDNGCAFCIVPSVRGREISRPFAEVVEEVRQLASQGVVEVTLLGQNVNSYGRDITTTLRSQVAGPGDHLLAGEDWAAQPRRRPRPLFGDLLRAVGSIAGIARVRFTSPHPKDLRPETIAAMAETDTVCEQLHLPLQSGSDRVLAAMRRGYTAERYLDRLAAARAAIPDLAVTTDIIVGFPGETERDFEATLEVVSEAAYDSAYTFQFSPRPGTRAAEMVDLYVPKEVVSERFARLAVVVERSSLARHRARVGRTEEVLVEGPARKDPSKVAARTRQHKLVLLDRSAELRPGSFTSARIVASGAHHLQGEVVEGIRHPKRIRLALAGS